MRRARRQARIVLVISFFVLFTGLLLARLFSLQLLQGLRLARQAVAQRTDTYVYASGRGQILDRNGLSLHASLQEVYPKEAYHTAPGLAHVYLQNLELTEEVRYSATSVATHVTGYIRKPVNPLQPCEGLSGLERAFNRELWGTPAAVGVIVDAKRQMVPGYGISEWKYEHLRRPYNVVTTIDRKLQAAAETAGKAAIKKGAFLLLDPRSGDILVLASFPRLPVEDLYSGTAGYKLEQMERDQVYLNRALMPYAVGSVFKVIVAAAALEAKLPGLEDRTFICDGSYELGDRQISCFAGTSHGKLDLQQALVTSCNGYFIDLALRLGKEKVLDMARRFKLGQATGIPLGGEEAGNIPAAADLLYGGDVANLAIGQGAVTATPLQLARVMTILANQGRDVYPRLVSKVTDKNGNTVRNYPVQYGSLVIAPALAHKLQQMLVPVVEAGTASPAKSGRYKAAGKSGTAQLAGKDYSRSWFAGMVDTGKETLVAVVLLEEHYAEEPTASAVFRRLMEAVLDAR